MYWTMFAHFLSARLIGTIAMYHTWAGYQKSIQILIFPHFPLHFPLVVDYQIAISYLVKPIASVYSPIPNTVSFASWLASGSFCNPPDYLTQIVCVQSPQTHSKFDSDAPQASSRRPTLRPSFMTQAEMIYVSYRNDPRSFLFFPPTLKWLAAIYIYIVLLFCNLKFLLSIQGISSHRREWSLIDRR